VKWAADWPLDQAARVRIQTRSFLRIAVHQPSASYLQRKANDSFLSSSIPLSSGSASGLTKWSRKSFAYRY